MTLKSAIVRELGENGPHRVVSLHIRLLRRHDLDWWARFKLHMGPSFLYPVARALERAGQLESYAGPPLAIRGNHSRVYYRLAARTREHSP